MRKRFRGNQPIAVSKELEGEKGSQLYGGEKAIGDAERKGQEEAGGEWYERNDGVLRKRDA